MAGIKKIARPINKAKNAFLKWLKDNGADNIDEYVGDADNIDEYVGDGDGCAYYRSITAFIGNAYYSIYFIIVGEKTWIEYNDDENKYENLSIEEFLELIK